MLSFTHSLRSSAWLYLINNKICCDWFSYCNVVEGWVSLLSFLVLGCDSSCFSRLVIPYLWCHQRTFNFYWIGWFCNDSLSFATRSLPRLPWRVSRLHLLHSLEDTTWFQVYRFVIWFILVNRNVVLCWNCNWLQVVAFNIQSISLPRNLWEFKSLWWVKVTQIILIVYFKLSITLRIIRCFCEARNFSST